MKIPKGMTEAEVIQVINKVVERQAAKFRFGYYEIEDMQQEAFIIAMDALERYDEKRPLENFLAVHVNNRLKNFKRDNFYRMNNEKHESKKLIMDPININRVRDEKENNMRVNDEFIEVLETKEIVDIIDKYLEINMREDYLKMINNVYVPKPRREQIKEAILTIMREHGQ
jgi:DNA-directed RNA polymerase specialized sigma subunit